MGRAPCCDKANVKKGPWSPEEDEKLKSYIENHGTGGNWISLPHKIGLRRCGKSCRLRWLNYLRPNIKHGGFSAEEDSIICNLYIAIGSRWSIIAAQLPGRTDNDIKNYWNTKLKKRFLQGKQQKLGRQTPRACNDVRQDYPKSDIDQLAAAGSVMMINSSCRINSIWPEYFHDNNISLHSPFRAGADHNNHQLQGSSIYKKIMMMKYEGSRSTFYSNSSNISTTTGVHQRQAVNALPSYAALPHDQAIISTSTTLNYDDIHHDQIPVTNYSSTTTSTHVAPSTNYINYGNHDTLKETSASLHSNIYADPLISFFEEYSMLKQLQGLGGFCGMESLI